MKKVITILMTVALFLALAVPACADFDLSGLSYEELVALKDQINLAIWNSEEWQAVTVPQGVWEVGADIPEGKWTIHAAPEVTAFVYIGDELKEGGTSVEWYIFETLTGTKYFSYKPDRDKTEFTVELEAGQYILIKSGNVIFTPYAGKPALGFK